MRHEEALKIAIEHLSKKIQIFKVTDDSESFKYRASMISIFDENHKQLLKKDCWYILYNPRLSVNGGGFFESSYIMAISKEDGSIVFDGCANDEG